MSTPKLPSLPVERLLKRSPSIASGVPEGLDALVLGELARHARDGRAVLHVARDANRLATLEGAIPFFAPDIEVLSFPAWDGVPYDRVAPNAETIAEREGCSVRKVNMTISLAFLAPHLVKAAIEGRLPHGMGVVRLCDLPAEWSRQHQMLGLVPQ